MARRVGSATAANTWLSASREYSTIRLNIIRAEGACQLAKRIGPECLAWQGAEAVRGAAKLRLPRREQSQRRRRLLLGAGFGRNQAGDAVIDRQLSVMLAHVLDEAVGVIDHSHLLFDEGVVEQTVHAGI